MQQHPICGRGVGGGQVTVLASAGTRAAAFIDLEGDGDLDIITGEFHSRPQVLVSDLSEQRDIRWLRVRLRGHRSNRDGLGAVLRLRVGDRELTRYHDGKTGYLSQGQVPIYVGLDGADVVDRLEVQWPSGHTQVLTNIKANQTLVIDEDG